MSNEAEQFCYVVLLKIQYAPLAQLDRALVYGTKG